MPEATDLETILKDRAQESDGALRLDCEVALALAEELDVPPARIGDLCNRLDIKIRSCQLNCF